jgi:hypothetical protein
MSIGFFHTVFDNKKATEYSIKTIRQFHPDSFYMISGDAGSDHYDLCKQYNINYYQSQKRLGYPTQPYGFRKEGIIEWLSRFYIACIKTDTTHLMMVEDDVVLVKPVTVEDHWEVSGHEWRGGNTFPPEFIRILENVSGKYPHVQGYGAGGGSIFKVSTFIQNYFQVVNFLNQYGDMIQDQIYPTMGWIDCFMTYYYMMAGKEYTINPHLYSIPLNPPELRRNYDLNNTPENKEIIHDFKNYYM